MKRVLIGTTNPNKLQLFRDYLSGLPVECVSPMELGLTGIPDEEEKTALDNAVAKARTWYKASGLPVITEDSGLVFLDLPADHPDQPGVHVRRAAGYSMSDDEMLTWYRAIIHRHGGSLVAAWQDAWCFYAGEDLCLTFEDSPEKLRKHARLLVETPCETRLPGWPLDSLTYFPAQKKYKAEMTMDEMLTAMDAVSLDAREERRQLLEWIRSAAEQITNRAEEC